MTHRSCVVLLLWAGLGAPVIAAAQSGQLQKPGEIQQPKGQWQVPGEIQQPKGPWQVPGEIQKPGPIQTVKEQCLQRFRMGADTLFEFDKSTLTPPAETTLTELGPMVTKAGKHPVSVEGHTDAIGPADYNQRLSEQRARTVRDWLAARGYVPATTTIKGYGKDKPVAPNTRPDGSDNPDGRALNRRVEVVIDTCRPG
jgi:outer membrane protein OmpA-like peptidoglycan-associated protein